MGPKAGSEPEVQAIMKFYLGAQRIVGAIDFHSFSQLVLRPYGWTEERAPHEQQHRELGNGMRDLIRKTHGQGYTSERAVDLYVASGGASDWFYGDQVQAAFGRRPFSYTIELRPKSMWDGGFVLPPRFILPVGEEIFPAVLYFAEYALAHPVLKD